MDGNMRLLDIRYPIRILRSFDWRGDFKSTDDGKGSISEGGVDRAFSHHLASRAHDKAVLSMVTTSDGSKVTLYHKHVVMYFLL